MADPFTFSTIDESGSIPVITRYIIGDDDGRQEPDYSALRASLREPTPQEVLDSCLRVTEELTGKITTEDQVKYLRNLNKNLSSIPADAIAEPYARLSKDQHDFISRLDTGRTKLNEWRESCINGQPSVDDMPMFDEKFGLMTKCAQTCYDLSQKKGWMDKDAETRARSIRQTHGLKQASASCRHWGSTSADPTLDSRIDSLWESYKTQIARFDPFKNFSKEELTKKIEHCLEPITDMDKATSAQVRRSLSRATALADVLSYRYARESSVEKPDDGFMNDLMATIKRVEKIGLLSDLEDGQDDPWVASKLYDALRSIDSRVVGRSEYGYKGQSEGDYTLKGTISPTEPSVNPESH